jgi:hypothetical protein
MNRIYHTWDKWECYPAGFYGNTAPRGMDRDAAELFYRDFLADIPLFKSCLQRVITEWKHSCEHYLTNERMNRIAWMGQTSVCIHAGIPSKFRGGYNLLTEEQQKAADEAALEYINKWFVTNGYDTMTMEQIQSRSEVNLY